MNKYISGTKIHYISDKYNEKKLKRLFNRGCYYNLNDFDKIITNNMDRQYGGGIKSVIKNLFVNLLEDNMFQKEKDENDKDFNNNILEDKLSEVKIAYKDMADTFKERFHKIKTYKLV